MNKDERDTLIDKMARASFEHEKSLDDRLARIEWASGDMHARIPQQLHRQYAEAQLVAIEQAGGYAPKGKDGGLLFQTYLGILVLRTMLKSSGLTLGADRTEKLLKDIEAAHPEYPGRSAMRKAAKKG